MLKSQGKILSNHTDNGYGVIPLSVLPKTYSDRILVVGEAAGQTKPTTGGGIYYGILCADMAVNVLHNALISGDYSAAKLSSYQKLWRAELGRELTVDHWAQRLWAKLSNRHIEYIFDTANKKGIPRLISTSTTFSFDWHRPILLQLAYSLLPFANSKKRL
jgi:flavin-dependent dehydrogenase